MMKRLLLKTSLSALLTISMSLPVEQLNSILPEHDYVCNIPSTDEKLEAALKEIERLQGVINNINRNSFLVMAPSSNGNKRNQQV